MLKYTRREFIKTGMLVLPMISFGGVSGLLASESDDQPVKDEKTIFDAKLAVIPRSDWASEEPKSDLLKKTDSYDRLTIHHAGNGISQNTDKGSVVQELAGILSAHIERNYGDIGYHLIVDYAGRVWEGRNLKWEGAHVSYENEKNVGVMLLGNFEKQQPSIEQIETMSQIVKILCDRYGITKQRIYGHRDLGQSVCPGKNLYPHVLQLKDEDREISLELQA